MSSPTSSVPLLISPCFHFPSSHFRTAFTRYWTVWCIMWPPVPVIATMVVLQYIYICYKFMAHLHGLGSTVCSRKRIVVLVEPTMALNRYESCSSCCFKRLLKTELFDIAYSECEHSAIAPPTRASDSLATYMVLYKFDLIWLIDWLIDYYKFSKKCLRLR